MSITIDLNDEIDVEALNKDIRLFPQVHPITEDMKITHEGVSRLVMLDRYAFKDTEKKTLKVGDFVVLTVKSDQNFPARGYGTVQSIDLAKHVAKIKVANEFLYVLDDEKEIETKILERSIDAIDKPLEVYYEQIAKTNATGLSAVEATKEKQESSFNSFSKELSNLNFVPAGRVLYGAGSETDVTYFNSYVMPFVQDS